MRAWWRRCASAASRSASVGVARARKRAATTSRQTRPELDEVVHGLAVDAAGVEHAVDVLERRPRPAANSSMPASIAPSGSSISQLVGGLQLDPVLGELLDRQLRAGRRWRRARRAADALVDVVVGDHAVVDGDRRREGVRGEGRDRASDREQRPPSALSTLRIVSPSPPVRSRAPCRRAPATPARPVADPRQPHVEADRGRGRHIIR